MHLMTTKKACEYLGIGLATFYRWVKSGKAPTPVIIDGRKWYTRENLDSWVRASSQEGQK